jgi:glutaredoxin 3
VPFVFIGETFVGGFSELKEIEFSGKLDELL